jgi:adenosine deaminase/aminodeoxyfutalosine deaminase
MPSDLEIFLRALPKAELHLHLEGTIAPLTLVELSKRHDGADALTLEAAEALYRYEDFLGFLQAFKSVTTRLRTPEDYELIAYEMIRQLAAQGVVHAEVYISVGIVYFRTAYWENDPLLFDHIFVALERARLSGERDFGVSLLWIFDAVRHFGLEAAAVVFRKAAELRERYPSIIGIGIGGDEAGGPAQDFHDLYTEASSHGLKLTCHAGESVGPESIWGAINIGSQRLGHVLTAQHDGELIEVLAERQIPLELNITSNLKTGCCRSLEEHPVRQYFDAGLMVTLNSDDPAMFGATLLEEYLLVATRYGFTRDQLRELAANSFEASFLNPEKKVEWLKKLESF